MDAPKNLHPTPVYRGVNLTWEPVEGAHGYNVYYGIDDVRENVEIVPIDKIERPRPAWTVRGLQPGKKYRFTVTAWREE